MRVVNDCGRRGLGQLSMFYSRQGILLVLASSMATTVYFLNS